MDRRQIEGVRKDVTRVLLFFLKKQLEEVYSTDRLKTKKKLRKKKTKSIRRTMTAGKEQTIQTPVLSFFAFFFLFFFLSSLYRSSRPSLLF